LFKKDLSCITTVASSDAEFDLPASIANIANGKSTKEEMCSYVCSTVKTKYSHMDLTPYQKYRSGIDTKP
jgi:hypothetical protein